MTGCAGIFGGEETIRGHHDDGVSGKVDCGRDGLAIGCVESQDSDCRVNRAVGQFFGIEVKRFKAAVGQYLASVVGEVGVDSAR